MYWVYYFQMNRSFEETPQISVEVMRAKWEDAIEKTILRQKESQILP
jgi:hypothetical protein